MIFVLLLHNVSYDYLNVIVSTVKNKFTYILCYNDLYIQPVSYKRYFRCTNCFLLLVYTINLSLLTDLVDPAPMGTFYMKHAIYILVVSLFCSVYNKVTRLDIIILNHVVESIHKLVCSIGLFFIVLFFSLKGRVHQF